MSEKKRKTLYWFFKVASIIISCLLPIYAICEHFPLWIAKEGAPRAIGSGLIISLIVVAIVFRKTVFGILKKKAKLENAPPLFVWLILIIVTYILVYISNFLSDLTIVLWMGLIGCGIGNLFTYIAESKFVKTEDENNGGA
jgi:hypothetical protein